jgi:hypothetical protein
MAFWGKTAAVLMWVPLLIWVAAEELVRRAVPPPPATIEPGVTFSVVQADALGLDWQDLYRAVLDDLGARRIRIPVYWSEVEPRRGAFNFSRFDFLVHEAEARNATIVIAVGQKLPRWPECHIPAWAEEMRKSKIENSDRSFEDALLHYVRAVIERYKNSSVVVAWQVENEPFFAFGECPTIPYGVVGEEVAAVKALDRRPVVVTDSGELGTWVGAARLGNIVGTTMYRTTWKRGFGYLHYFLPAGFYEKKAAVIATLFGKPVWVMEMQLEPWVPSPPISTTPIEEQMKSMNFDQFRANVAYARASRLSPVYFWGVEWWYWMKRRGYPEYWEYAREKMFRINRL